MVKIASYVKYRSSQITDLINLEIFNKTFFIFKKIEFDIEEENKIKV